MATRLTSLPFYYNRARNSGSLRSFFRRGTLLCTRRQLNGACYFIGGRNRFSRVMTFFAMSGSDMGAAFVPGPSTGGIRQAVPKRGRLHACPTMLLKELKIGGGCRKQGFLINRRIVGFVGA